MATKVDLINMFNAGYFGPIAAMVNNYMLVSYLHSIQATIIRAFGGKKYKPIKIWETHPLLWNVVKPKEKEQDLYDKLQSLRGKWYGSSNE